MFKRYLHSLLTLSLVLVLTACGEYQKVLKSTDNAYKLEKAIEYYDNEEYTKALPLFEELMNVYRGSTKAPEVYYYYAYTHYAEAKYLLAAYHFKNFAKTFAGNEHAEECAFMSAKCYYLDSPRPTLEQSNTYKAMEELQLFINTHPGSKYIDECNELMKNLRTKLETKSLLIAKNYYEVGSYQASIVAYNNTLNEFPDTKRKEEIYYYQFLASFELAKNSVEEKKLQRLKEAAVVYSALKRAYPESQYLEEASKLNNELTEMIEKFNNA